MTVSTPSAPAHSVNKRIIAALYIGPAVTSDKVDIVEVYFTT